MKKLKDDLARRQEQLNKLTERVRRYNRVNYDKKKER